jgi:hypothetical protein
MSTSSNQWYVEMSAGITLGPMPFDAVVELAGTSAIMPSDRIREESSKSWRSAHEVPGLFTEDATGSSDSGVISLSGFEAPETDTESETSDASSVSDSTPIDVATAELQAEPKEMNVAEPKTLKPKTPEPVVAEPTDGVVRLNGFELLLGESRTAGSSSDAEFELLRAAASLETVKPSSEPDPRPKPAPEPKPEPEPKLKPEAKLEPELRNESVRKPPALPPATGATGGTLKAMIPAEQKNVAPGSAQRRTPEADVPPEISASVVPPKTEDDVVPPSLPTLPNPAVRHRPVQTPIQPWRAPIDRRRQLLVRTSAAVVAMVVVLSLVWLLRPNVEEATFDQYAALYEEYKQVSLASDEGSWSAFTVRAKTTLDESLPGLEAATGPGEQSKSILLYAGRDLRNALNLSHGTPNPHEQRMAGFFQQLYAIHDSQQ